jgi:hypothetical protein
MIMNQKNLIIGAYQQSTSMGSDPNWMPMGTAPRDGTPVEIRCTYGVAPWYGVFCWNGNEWVKFKNPNSSVSADKNGNSTVLTWRPLRTDPDHYVDPTGGAQDTSAYWRGAVAAKYGIPLDSFEALAAKNEQSNRITVTRDHFFAKVMRLFALIGNQ